MTISELRAYADQGITLRQMTRITNTPYATAHNRAERFGVAFRRGWQIRIENEFNRSTRELFESLADRGYSQTRAALILGIDRGTLARYAKKEGIIFTAENPRCRPWGVRGKK